jgi:hypothetical protein
MVKLLFAVLEKEQRSKSLFIAGDGIEFLFYPGKRCFYSRATIFDSLVPI